MAEVTIAALAEAGALTFSDGYRTKRSEHGRPGYRILRVADVADGRVDLDGPDFVSDEYQRSIGSKLSQAGDVLLTTKGTVGRVAVFPADAEQVVYSPQLCFFRVTDPTTIHPRFLAYWFKSESFVRQASHRANNTDMAAYINLGDIASLSLDLPSATEQEAIAEVLGALDDKIAANKETTELLLALADAQFVKAVAGSNPGPLTFGEVADIGGGGTPRTTVHEYWGGAVQWATPTDVTALGAPYLAGTSRTITDEGLAACSSALYPVGSILMTSRATIGAFAVAKVPTAVNQGFIVVNAKNPAHQWWLFHEMKSRVPEFLSFANGATFLELPRGRFKGLNVRVASGDAMAEFGSAVGRLHESAAAFVAESETLARTRDALLPLLMSGKVRVKDAEKTVEGVL